MYMYNLALREMPSEERLGSEGEFKPNLVNSVCYLVELGVQVGGSEGGRAGLYRQG